MILPLCFGGSLVLDFAVEGLRSRFGDRSYRTGFVVAMRIAIVEVLLHPEGWGLIPEVIFLKKVLALHKRTS